MNIDLDAVRQILNRKSQPIPVTCPYCTGKVFLVENKELYGKNYGRWPYGYLCKTKGCGAFVGCHPNTHLPMGTMANTKLRKMRSDVHKHFDALWKDGPFSRRKAYQLLANGMRLDIEDCHISWFDLEQCALAFQVAQQLEAVHCNENIQRCVVDSEADSKTGVADGLDLPWD